MRAGSAVGGTTEAVRDNGVAAGARARINIDRMRKIPMLTKRTRLDLRIFFV